MSDKKDKYILSEESAKAQADLLLENYGTDLEESRGLVALSYHDLLLAIRRGRIVVDISSGETVVKQILLKPVDKVTELTYREITAADDVALGSRAKGDNPAERQYVILSILSDVELSTMLKLKGADRAAAQALATLFLLL